MILKGKCPNCSKDFKVKTPSFKKPIDTYDQAMLSTLSVELKDLVNRLGKIAESTSLLSCTRDKATQLLGVIDNVKGGCE